MRLVRPEIHSHTSLRGLAALGVAALHYRRLLPGDVEGSLSWWIFLDFHIFVDLFFVLSGFVIGYVYQSAFSADPSAAQYGRFLRTRLARIYPLYLITTLFFVATATLGTTGRAIGVPDLLLNLGMLQGWVGERSINFVAWSVSGEWAAYVLFPILPVLARTRMGVLTLVLAIAALYGFRAATIGSLDLTDAHQVLTRALPGFALGYLTYLCWLERPSWTRSWLSAAQVISLAGILLIKCTAGNEFLYPPLLALLIFSTADDRGLLPAILCRAPFRRLGQWSYSIYMIHLIVLYLILKAVDLAGGSQGDIAGLPGYAVCLVIAVAASALTFELFEKPSRAFLRSAKRPRNSLPSGSITPAE